MDHFEDFYKQKLNELGYDTEMVVRREIDAELIGWKRDKFKLVGK